MGLIRYSYSHISGPHQILDVDLYFHHAPPIQGIQNAEMQKKGSCDVIASVLYTNFSQFFVIELCVCYQPRNRKLTKMELHLSLCLKL